MEMILATIDGATLSITTNEPQQNEVTDVRLNALNATPGPDFFLSFVDKTGVTRSDTFPVGSDTTRNIAPPARSNFVLVNRVRPSDGATVLMLSQPEYVFRRLSA